MEDMTPCSKDREIFQRVWQRVMEGRADASSPILANAGVGEGDMSCASLEALLRQEEGMPQGCGGQDMTAQPVQPEAPSARQEPPAEEPPMEEPPMEEAPVPEPPCGGCGEEGLPEEDGPHRGNDLPRSWEEPQAGDDRTARLRCHVLDALEGWQFYRHLARRTRGNDARTLNAMAGEQHKEARRLSAAYFLLTGLRYWPTETLGMPAIPSYWGALRARHQAEQRQENAYNLAADDWEDPDMLTLYSDLAQGCQGRSRRLRGLLEEGIT